MSTIIPCLVIMQSNKCSISFDCVIADIIRFYLARMFFNWFQHPHVSVKLLIFTLLIYAHLVDWFPKNRTTIFLQMKINERKRMNSSKNIISPSRSKEKPKWSNEKFADKVSSLWKNNVFWRRHKPPNEWKKAKKWINNKRWNNLLKEMKFNKTMKKQKLQPRKIKWNKRICIKKDCLFSLP